MERKLFFSYGLTKSGSTLAFQLARTALIRAGHDQPQSDVPGLVVSKKINAIQHVSDTQAAALLGGPRPLILKTHTRCDPAVASLFARGHATGHAVIRDPRDIALSMLDNGRVNRAKGRPAFAEIVTLDDAIAAIENQMATLATWLALPDFKRLRYDRLAFDTVAAARDILDHLGLDGDPTAIAAHVLENEFIQFNVGRRDRWRSEMAAADAARIHARFAPFYDLVLATDAPLPPGTALVDKSRAARYPDFAPDTESAR